MDIADGKMNILNLLVSNPTMSDPLDESQLVARLRDGDEAAFAMLVRRYQTRLYGLAYAMTLDREESRDIVQEVFLKAFRHIGTFKGESKLSTWLHRITVNQCLNWKRRWVRRRVGQHRALSEESGESAAVTLPDERTPETRFRQEQLRRQFLEALQALPGKARAVYVLKEIEERSYDEIAQTLGISRGTVSSRLHYARRRLQSALQHYHNGA